MKLFVPPVVEVTRLSDGGEVKPLGVTVETPSPAADVRNAKSRYVVFGWRVKVPVVAVVEPFFVFVAVATTVSVYTTVSAMPAPHVPAAELLLASPG
jgi:hypothetical protein